MEEVMIPRLRALGQRTGVIGDVRGRGAMVAAELVRPGTRDPDPELTGRIARACHTQGVVVLTAGTFGNVLRFLPPLVMDLPLLGEGFDVVEAAVTDLAG
jgi:4-aminobutyrate aminotransferase / (S)-3-amino-2-methylpropionate transaminase / 5-aminovalerate transaminase